MSDFSNYLENKLVDHIFRNRSFSAPANVYVSLHTADPLDAGSGTEVSGGSYARVAVATGDTAFTATQGGTTGASSGTGGATENGADIEFPVPSANWGSITHFGIWDAATTGNLLFKGALGTAKTVNNGDPAPKFSAGDLTVTLA